MASGEASPMSLNDGLGASASTQPQSSSTASNLQESASASVKKRMSLADYKKRKLSQVDNAGSFSGSQPATPTTATPLTSGLSSLPPLPLPSLPPLGLLPHETDHNKDSRERSRHSSH